MLGRRRSGSGTPDKPAYLAVLDPSSRLFLRGLLALVVWFPALTEEADSGQLGDRVEEEEAGKDMSAPGTGINKTGSVADTDQAR